MAISQTKQAQLTTPEAVYDQPPAPRPNGTNSGKNRLSAGAITGMAVGASWSAHSALSSACKSAFYKMAA